MVSYIGVCYQIYRCLFEFTVCQLHPKELKDKEYDLDEEMDDSDDYEEGSDEADDQYVGQIPSIEGESSQLHP